jgi:hypothetical protein
MTEDTSMTTVKLRASMILSAFEEVQLSLSAKP